VPEPSQLTKLAYFLVTELPLTTETAGKAERRLLLFQATSTLSQGLLPPIYPR
jgi:inorganic triphosphatase YgiF